MTINATGASGVVYTFYQHEITVDWYDIPAIYMFAYPNVAGWRVLYIGQCESAKNRLPCHERWDEAKRSGATHVLAHRGSEDLQQRLREERDLIEAHKPAMNTHHVGNSLLGRMLG